jgi:hypothetical protein
MKSLLTNLILMFVITIGLCSITFPVLLIAGMQELSGGAPMWMNVIGYVLLGVTGLSLVWLIILTINKVISKFQ